MMLKRRPDQRSPLQVAVTVGYFAFVFTFLAAYLATESGMISWLYFDHWLAACVGALVIGLLAFGLTFLQQKYREHL